MPATEQTWRNQRLLHALFALSSLAMLGVTLWMFAADHDREWKGYQRTFRQAETTMIIKSELDTTEKSKEQILEELRNLFRR